MEGDRGARGRGEGRGLKAEERSVAPGDGREVRGGGFQGHAGKNVPPKNWSIEVICLEGFTDGLLH